MGRAVPEEPEGKNKSLVTCPATSIRNLVKSNDGFDLLGTVTSSVSSLNAEFDGAGCNLIAAVSVVVPGVVVFLMEATVEALDRTIDVSD